MLLMNMLSGLFKFQKLLYEDFKIGKKKLCDMQTTKGSIKNKENYLCMYYLMLTRTARIF